MKKLMCVTTVMAMCSAAWAQTQLEKEDIVAIFQTLTQNPSATWIKTGDIEANHQQYRAAVTINQAEIAAAIDRALAEYRNNAAKPERSAALKSMKTAAIPFNVTYELSNEYTADAKEVVRVDGKRFYWEIETLSRKDSVARPADLAGNDCVDVFDLNANQKRVFAYDGQQYITYFRPVNYADITTERGNVTGPLTAGVIPWGLPGLTLNELSQSDLSAVMTEADGNSEITIVVTNGEDQRTFVLDPEKNYAVKLYSVASAGSVTDVTRYSDYKLTSGKWYPGAVVIEKYDNSQDSPRLIATDIWTFTAVNTNIPADDAFKVNFEPGAMIEDFHFDSESLKYRCYDAPAPELSKFDAVADELITRRLRITNASDSVPGNCATIALDYVCEKLGAEISGKELAQLVTGPEQKTTMLQMKNYIRDNTDLNCLAVNTSLDNLKKFSDAAVILHLPEIEHYVVLAGVEADLVRLIDLDSNKFYITKTIDQFNQIWKGNALVVSDNTRNFDAVAKLDDSALQKIVGAMGFECADECQSASEIKCNSGESCDGYAQIYYKRTCCCPATAGTCPTSSMIRYKESHCISDPQSPGDCTDNGDWTSYFMDACN